MIFNVRSVFLQARLLAVSLDFMVLFPVLYSDEVWTQQQLIRLGYSDLDLKKSFQSPDKLCIQFCTCWNELDSIIGTEHC